MRPHDVCEEVMRSFAKNFYFSAAWKAARDGYAASRGGLCEDCLENGVYTPGEIVHHMTELTPENINSPQITLAWENLRLVCRECHAKRHKKWKMHRRYKVDQDGHVTPAGE